MKTLLRLFEACKLLFQNCVLLILKYFHSCTEGSSECQQCFTLRCSVAKQVRNNCSGFKFCQTFWVSPERTPSNRNIHGVSGSQMDQQSLSNFDDDNHHSRRFIVDFFSKKFLSLEYLPFEFIIAVPQGTNISQKN